MSAFGSIDAIHDGDEGPPHNTDIMSPPTPTPPPIELASGGGAEEDRVEDGSDDDTNDVSDGEDDSDDDNETEAAKDVSGQPMVAAPSQSIADTSSDLMANATSVMLSPMNVETPILDAPTTDAALPVTKRRGVFLRIWSFFKSRWGLVTLVALLLFAVAILVARSTTRRRDTDDDSPDNGGSPPSGKGPPESGTSSRHHLDVAWETSAAPTDEDKIVLFDMSGKSGTYQCCAPRLFKDGAREVRLTLPRGGDYAVRAMTRRGEQQVCNTEHARRIAFEASGTRCTDRLTDKVPLVDIASVCEPIN